MNDIGLVVCEGDETGQELLEESLRVLEPAVIGLSIDLHRFDLSLANRRRTRNAVVIDAADAMLDTGLGLKAATVTPTAADDVGTPNRILREAIRGTVIVRTGRRIPGVNPVAALTQPIVVVRMAVGGAYGATEERIGVAGSISEHAMRIERIERVNCRAVAEYAFVTARNMAGRVYGGPKWTVSPVYEGMFKEELDAAAARHPGVDYEPVLIDAAYAGLMTNLADQPLVVPTLNRDGDCMSDLVLAMYGSIAGAESILIALNTDLSPRVAMAEAPHGTAPSLSGKNVANPMATLLAAASILDHAGQRGHAGATAAGSHLRNAILSTAADGTRTFDLGGTSTTSEVVDEVIRRLTGPGTNEFN